MIARAIKAVARATKLRRLLRTAQAIPLRSGDLLVIRLEEPSDLLPEEHADLRELFPDNRVLLVEPGITCNSRHDYLAEAEWRREVMGEAKEALACGDSSMAYAALSRHETAGYPFAQDHPTGQGPPR